ncbi:MAG: HAD family hydrolase [Actinobacteria bacterium]|nr:MAG: HAD family hydrolase [Actinomycetota bacterium]
MDAVLLDAGGVLLLPDPAELRRVLAPFGRIPDDETCRRAHYASMREVDRIGGPDWPAVDRVLARVAGVDEDRLEETVSVVEEVYLHLPWVPVPDAAETLLALQAAGYPLAVVSNATGTMEQQLADHRICTSDGGHAARVAVVVDSDVVGVEKPDPAIFGFALDALGLPPDDCLYVGDTVHFDVNGARAAGLRPVHLDPFGLCPDADHAHVGSLAELAGQLIPSMSPWPGQPGAPGDP